MARWSGAKARSGYYASMREKPNRIGYSPSDPENKTPWKESSATHFDITCIAIFIMLAPISIPFLILASPMIISSYVKKQKQYSSRNQSVKSKFCFRTETVLFSEKRLVLSRSAAFELDENKSLSGAQVIIDRLNKQQHAGINSWRIPSSKEFSDILRPGKEACMSIYEHNGDSYPLPEIYNDIGFMNVRAQYYITKQEIDMYNNRTRASYEHLNEWAASSYMVDKRVFLWPISDMDGFTEGYDMAGYDHEGYDREGYNKAGYDFYGYDKEGYNKAGYCHDGYDRDGLDRDGNMPGTWYRYK